MNVKDKNGTEINDNVPFLYKAIKSKPPIRTIITTKGGERWISWEDGVKYLLTDFWFNGIDEGLSEIITEDDNE